MPQGLARSVLLIAGMRDNACRERIREALEGVSGVCQVDVNLFRAQAVVFHVPPCVPARLIDAVALAGYSATPNGVAHGSNRP